MSLTHRLARRSMSSNDARQRNQVFDLSSTVDTPPSVDDVVAESSDNRSLFSGVKLKDVSVGDRLGASRDGGEGFQGCNSRVFRVTLRHPRRHELAIDLNGVCQAPRTLTSTPSTGTGTGTGTGCGSGCGIGRSDSIEPLPTPRASGGGFVTELMGLGEQFIQGSFGACFGGNAPSSSRDSAEEVEISEEGIRNRNRNGKGGVGAEGCCRSPRAGGCRRDTEFALKMALTYRGQDPAQAEREMATEIAVLVGGRIPPHANIMRGVHSFQDHVGPDLQKVLWAGLGPEAGEMLSPRTSFLVMPLFTLGSLEALLNKRRLRCKGPPFLRLLDTMRFLKQMLSAVQHLLAHGLAHNDIKPANWLIAADQRSLVLTDFGACIDSLRPHSKPPNGQSSTPEPTLTTVPRDAVVVPGVQGKSSSTLVSAACAGRELQPADEHALTAIRVSAPGATGVLLKTETSGGARTERPLDVLEDTPAVSSSTAGQSLPESIFATSQPLVFSGNVSSPFPIDARGRVAAVSGGRKRQRCSEGTDSGSTSAGMGGGGSACGSDSGGSGNGSGSGSGTGRARKFSCDERAAADPPNSAREPSEALVFPFSEYFVAGTPSIVAPELARAWRDRTELDFRRSDIFSVGVCMYHMLRPGGADFDIGPRPLGKGPSRYAQEGRSAVVWPLTLFPEDSGGCPFEVSQLCRGFLQPDPSRRQNASDGLSLVGWIMSHLESAEVRDQSTASDPRTASTAAAATAATGTGTVPTGGGGDVQKAPAAASCQSFGKTHGGRLFAGSGGGGGASLTHGAIAGGEGSRSSSAAAAVNVKAGFSEEVAASYFSHPEDVLLREAARMLQFRDTRVDGACLGQGVPYVGNAASGWGKEGRGLVRAAGTAVAAVGKPSCEGEHCLREPDALVRSDRISHMRDTFASAAPEDLHRVLAAHGWDVPTSCEAFTENGNGRHNNEGEMDAAGGSAAAAAASTRAADPPASDHADQLVWDRARSSFRASSGHPPTPNSPVKLWFDGVAEELKGRYRGPSLPRPTRKRLYGNRR